MQYKIKDIGAGGIDVQIPVTEAWLTAECPDLEASPLPSGIKFTGRIEPSGEDFLLRGKLKGGLVAPCARCLEPASLPLEADVAVCYSEKVVEDGEEEDVDAEDVLPIEDGIIDLTGELRDEILLALPQSPLCREDCAGLCSVCGGNRNSKPCDCEARQREATGKFGSLAKLKI